MFWASNCMIVIPNIRHLSCHVMYLSLTDGIRTCYWQQLFNFSMLTTNGEPGTELYSLSKRTLQIQPQITYKGLKTVTTYSSHVLLSWRTGDQQSCEGWFTKIIEDITAWITNYTIWKMSAIWSRMMTCNLKKTVTKKCDNKVFYHKINEQPIHTEV